MIILHGVELSHEQADALLKVLRKEYRENKDKRTYISKYLKQEMFTKYVYYLIQYLESRLQVKPSNK